MAAVAMVSMKVKNIFVSEVMKLHRNDCSFDAYYVEGF
jgi:hypothetical protein